MLTDGERRAGMDAFHAHLKPFKVCGFWFFVFVFFYMMNQWENGHIKEVMYSTALEESLGV